MPLIKDGAYVDDAFVTVGDDDALPDTGVIVSSKRFAAERDALLARNTPLGVALAAGQSPEELGDDVHRFAVIALDFPVFKDGRAFSWARMLRTRLKYKGEIRATGGFLLDQVNFMCRVGIDAFDGDARITPEGIAAARKEMSNVYQPAQDGRTTIRDLRAMR